jgi:predicted DNA-binding transcriptional regulator YafY
MDVRGTTEVLSWVLGFGDKARVLEPVDLRVAIAEELRRAAHTYLLADRA